MTNKRIRFYMFLQKWIYKINVYLRSSRLTTLEANLFMKVWKFHPSFKDEGLKRRIKEYQERYDGDVNLRRRIKEGEDNYNKMLAKDKEVDNPNV